MLKVQLREGTMQQSFLRRSIAMLSMRTFFIRSCALESHLLGQGRPCSNGSGVGTAGHCRRRLKQFPVFRGSALGAPTRHVLACLQRFLWNASSRGFLRDLCLFSA